MFKVAKFRIGDVVVHQKQGYRGVIIDVDPIFQPSGRYNPQASKREFTTRHPWYRVLVDDSSQMTYVEENLLNLDSTHQSVNNPNLDYYLKHDQGIYRCILRGH